VLSAPSLQNHSIPPRSTEKSYRLRASNRTMVGVLEPSRVACAASGPKASNHQVMRPASRNCRLPWSVRSTSRIQSLSRSQIGLDANHHIHHLSERTEGNSFLDIPSHRTHRAIQMDLCFWQVDVKPASRTRDCGRLTPCRFSMSAKSPSRSANVSGAWLVTANLKNLPDSLQNGVTALSPTEASDTTVENMRARVLGLYLRRPRERRE
jgi:hypothetical protein